MRARDGCITAHRRETARRCAAFMASIRARTLAAAMPLPPHVLIGTERPRRGRFDGIRFIRWLHRPDRRQAPAAAPPAAQAPAPRATQVDEGTRGFWAGSETANVTSRRAAALIDAHERGRPPICTRP